MHPLRCVSPALFNDPRDPDRDGQITLADRNACQLKLPPLPCNGGPACSSVKIDEATGALDANGLPIVPEGKMLHLHYTFSIVNQTANSFTMIFDPPDSKTQDINSGGGKDAFGCEQVPDPKGSPGTLTNIPNYQGAGFTFLYSAAAGNQCAQSRFQVVAPAAGPVNLAPGQFITFKVDMTTRVNNGGIQEFSSAGVHMLDSGFAVKWFQNNNAGLHSFSAVPLSVDVR